MGTRKRKPSRPAIRPSHWLGFLFWAMVAGFAAFVVWQWKWVEPTAPYNFGPQQWVVAIAAATAMGGWIVASMITVRNSVKQHTINTLLQSRLSATYMAYADKLGAHYAAYAKRKAENPCLSEKPTDGVDMPSLRYITNYFEFIAVGVRTGDLDEKMLRDSLRTILIKNVEMSRDWIEESRDAAPRVYRNLAWLHARWASEEEPLRRRMEDV